jgi:hypothetical protein
MNLMRKESLIVHTALAASAALVLLAGCGQEKKPEDGNTAYSGEDPLALSPGDAKAPMDAKKYNTNIPPLDALKRQYDAFEAQRQKELEPKRQYAINKLYKPFTVYPQQKIPLPQLPRSKVYFARNPEAEKDPTVCILTSTDPPDQIEKYYANKLQKEGWIPVKMTGNASYHEVIAVKGDKEMTVTIYIGVYKDTRVVRLVTKPKRRA